MKPLRTWLARLGIFGALAIVSGCGSGDVPDPGADGEVAQLPDAAPPVLAQPVPAPAAAQNQDAAADEKPAEGKAEETVAQAQPAAPAAAESAAPAPADPSPDRDSATAEMLALASKAQPAPAPAADAAPGDAPATPAGGAPAPAGGGPGPGGGAMNMGPGMGRMNMGPNAPGGGGMNPNQMQAGMQNQMRAQMQQQGNQAQMQARMQGGPGGMGPGGGMMGPGGGPPGMGGANSKPPDFRTPEGAVQAFLDALKDRDLGRLTEATALRAQNESVKHNQEMFKRIFDGSLSKAEIDDLAAKLDGFKITSFNPPHSSGRLDIIVGKRLTNGNRVTIKITTRKEKKGWGVCDISRPAELKNPRMGPIRSQPKR